MRWARAAIAVGLVGLFGGCGSSGGEQGAPACTPATCDALGAACGQAGDGCGGVLECGACPPGQTCGGGGTANACGAPPASCAPTTCAAQGRTCGAIPDGCGGTLDCGGCGQGEVCTSERTCGPAPCTPTTCAAQGKDCGAIADGCGGQLECGSCPTGQTCGGAGNQNVCGVPAPGSEVLWYALRSSPGPDAVVGAGVDGEGHRLLLSTTRHDPGPGGTLFLEKRDHDGKLLWTRSWEFEGYPMFRMAVTRLGNVLLAVDAQCWYSCDGIPGLDLGGGTLGDSALVKLAPDGKLVWQVELAGQGLRDLSTDDSGSALVVAWPRAPASVSVRKYAWDGELLWSQDTGWIDAAALAPSGEAYLAGRSGDPLVPGAPAPASGWTAQLVKLGTDGKFQWSVRSDALGYVSAVRTTAKGTMVLLADRAGTLTWGDSTVENGGLVLAVLEPDGRPRWARGVERLWPALLGVDPTGRAVVAGAGPGCGALTLRAFDLANTPLWTRTVPFDGACGSLVYGQALAYGADHEVTVGVSFTGTLTVAGDRLVPQAEDGLALELAP